MNLRISTDIGGTFTDLVCVDDVGEIKFSKSSTTPENHALGVFDALDLLAEQYRMPVRSILRQCRSFIHGSTIATNAMIMHNTAKIGLILTRGHRDILTLREGGKEDPFDTHVDYPEPYVPRYLTTTVTERINAEGEVEIPLDEQEVRQVIHRLVDKLMVEGIAVSLLWSIINPAHEVRIGEIIEEEIPGFSYSLSHKVNPIIREYRRTVSTAMDASLLPIVKKYTGTLDGMLKENGYERPLYMVTSSGALLEAGEIIRRPLYTVDSGPSMAPRAGLLYTTLEGDRKQNIITLDMGGTSFDITVATRGRLALTRETHIANETLAIMKVNSKSIGAGGGSIAWVDPGKMVHVGPQSAQAMPGPACYMQGGEQPTVTDANVVLGYLDPDYFLGGRMKINPRLSEKVITEKIGKLLNLDVLEAAYTIWTTINHNMIAAIQDVTIWQGVDPREYRLVSGGGAAGLHVVPMAKELKMKTIVVPKLAGVLSAVGGLAADMTMDFHSSHFTSSGQFDYKGVNRQLKDLEAQARAFLSRTGVAAYKTEVHFFTEARYAYQVWELNITLRGGQIEDEEALAVLVEDFHAVHRRVFGICERGEAIEFVNWGAQAVARMPDLRIKKLPPGSKDPSYALAVVRPAYFRELGGLVATPVYRGEKLLSGACISSPAIIEESATTIVVFPGSRAKVSQWGNYLIEL